LIAATGLLALAGVLGITMLAGPAEAAKRKKRGVVVKTMTRNVYLGSSLQAGLSAPSLQALCDGAREIFEDVTSTNPPARMRAIANEILKKKPDLVGLQELAAWYVQSPGDGRPPEFFGGGTLATNARYDLLRLIMNRLNKGKKRYKVVRVQNEFEFEAELDLDGNNGTDGPAPDCTDAEADGRMLIRDAIIKRVRVGVRTSKPSSGNYVNQRALHVAGIPFPVKRGWQSVNARVRGSKPFRFVNTHLESFDDHPTQNDMFNTQTGTTTAVSRGTIRKTQATELVGPGGPARSKGPVILVGDLNSNVPPVQSGDEQAFQAVLAAGFKRRSTQRPPSCCIVDPSSTLTGGSLADFDHVVDHILANKKRIKRVASSVTGRAKVADGRWPSDHAGVFSALRVPRKR
jgi:endonuclease/exonuclease/phosphatase family metal-dependent hydrolase